MRNPELNEINNDLWDKYQETKSIDIRNKILMAYLYIVTVNAKRMSTVYKNKAELEDIVNQGVLALMDCIDRYDWQRGVQFDTFASIRVRGSIIDYLRKQDWIPRDIRKMSLKIENAYLELQTKMDRTPTDKEVAASLGIGMDDFHKVLSQSNSFVTLSYEELLSDIGGFKEPTSSIVAPEQKIQENELTKMVASTIDRLNEKERLIVSLYYYENISLKEIAAILGITPSRVSQIHTKALLKMQLILSEYIKD